MELRGRMPSRERRLPTLLASQGDTGWAVTDLPLRPRSASLQIPKTPYQSPAPTATPKFLDDPTSHSTLRTSVVFPPTLKPERLSYISNSADSGVFMDEEERNAQRALGRTDNYNDPWVAVSSASTDDQRPACVIPVADEVFPRLDNVQQLPRPRSIDSRESYDDEDDGCTVIQDVTDGELDKILSVSLQVLYGMELTILDQSRKRHLGRVLTVDFVKALGKMIHDSTEWHDEPTDAATPNSASSNTNDDAGIHRSHRAGAAHTATCQQGVSDDDVRGSNDRRGDAFVATASRKRPRGENVRLACPFRAKNQLRFNVRDYQGCALVSFPSMSDLRQHVVKVHQRYDQTKFPCDRCNVEFPTKSEQQQHTKQMEPCLPRPVDPEDGIDNDTVPRILKRGRESSQAQGESSVEVQYAELWRLIFPDSHEVPDHNYHVVMEDIDLESAYNGLLPIFMDDLRFRFNPADDQLLSKHGAALIDYLNMAVRNCRTKAKNMMHHNKPRAANPGAKRPRGQVSAFRDSAIDTDACSIYGTLGEASGPSPLSSSIPPFSQPVLEAQSVANFEGRGSGALLPDITPPNEVLAASFTDPAHVGGFMDVGHVSLQGLETADTLSHTHGPHSALPLPRVPFSGDSDGPMMGGWTMPSGGDLAFFAPHQHQPAEHFQSHHRPNQNEPWHHENSSTRQGQAGSSENFF